AVILSLWLGHSAELRADEIRDPVIAMADTTGGPILALRNNSSVTAQVEATLTGVFTVSVDTSGTGSGFAMLDVGTSLTDPMERVQLETSGGPQTTSIDRTFQLTINPGMTLTLPDPGTLHADATASLPGGTAEASARVDDNGLFFTNVSDADVTVIA